MTPIVRVSFSIFSFISSKEIIPLFVDSSFVGGIHQLIELLDIIAEERPKIIANKIDLLTENAEKAQETYSKLCNIENAWQNINDCLEQYKKITKEL